MKSFLVLCLIFFFNHLTAQPGCTDPQALNYNTNASENDGSCIYPMTTYDLTQISELPESLNEASGLAFFDANLWIHNDGGDENKIYTVDTLNTSILRNIVIENAENVDWEDFAESEAYLFLGDFGNNDGNRTDLKIYRINKTDLSEDTITAEIIEFEYSDQVDFSENPNNNNFDCEAFIFYENQLHLFSKNWVDSQTKHYTLSPEPGQHIAALKETYDVNGLITAADISEDGEIVLLGYNSIGLNFMWLLFDFSDSDFFSGNKRRIELGSALSNSQTEGISFRENGFGYVCSEQFIVNAQITLPQKLLSFSIKQWTDFVDQTQNIWAENSIRIYPNPSENYFQVEHDFEYNLNWNLYDSRGFLVRKGILSDRKTKIDNSNLKSGTYYFVLSKGKRKRTLPIFIK